MDLAQTFSGNFWILFIICLAVCLAGFYKYVYFISLGYGFSISAMGVAMLIIFSGNLTAVGIICCLLLFVYGIRLGGYLLIREIKSKSYSDAMKKEIKDGSSIKMIAKISIWVSCAFLYVLQISPVLYGLQNGGGSYAGAIIMLCGILVESIADAQKSKAKKENPARFCDRGLYKIVRCPNYFGEILFWTGVLVSGIGGINGAWQWCVAILGYVCIVYIMFGGARRLEIRQDKNYGETKEYQDYVKSTPIIIPFIPLYSVKKHKWLVG